MGGGSNILFLAPLSLSPLLSPPLPFQVALARVLREQESLVLKFKESGKFLFKTRNNFIETKNGKRKAKGKQPISILGKV